MTDEKQAYQGVIMPNANNELELASYDYMAEKIEKSSEIDPDDYTKYNVKRGLRNANGTGVVVGLTKIGDVEGYKMENGQKLPMPGKLYYRGIDVDDIVTNVMAENRFGYEETSYLLMFGELPTERQLRVYKKHLASRRELPLGFTNDMILSFPSKNIMNKLARTVLGLYCFDERADDNSVPNVIRQSLDLIGYFPTMIAYAYQAKHSYYDNESLYLHYPDPEKSTAENLLRMLRPTGEYTDTEAKMLDISMILHAEHGGGNNSAFTTHLVSSSGTDTYSAIASAVCALKGPKHGGASVEVLAMVNDLKANVKDWHDEKQVEEYLLKLLNKEAFDRKGLIYGIGHAVYTISDPREVQLKKMAKKLAEEKGLMDDYMLYDFIERRAPELIREYKVDKPTCANVDLYSGFVYNALGIPDDLAAPIFAASRISGWCAHRIEELLSDRIIRPAYINVQEPQEYVPIEKR